ncbi:alpha/beta hydrolase [Novosphingobium sp. MBES04]|uniref:alpha/beta hydrolase n=1 Tax=Novosphingobium sp. MBES04 TaxID=1206458 RepID=UPI00057E695D|nr:alpha/beta fold hydrolase [Novosphingobium sp. MBES04]GAM05898.1 alpha/beta fold family hydrolase/acetyltransferase [Novosphingobium sp. MBES04]
MEITRHFVDVGSRRVHYRRCGAGPVVLMVHQSPRSSTEYEALMRTWGANFTCIAPDTPGFGQSDPLPEADATIDDFSDALVDLLDALGLEKVAAYGFHSGGTILVNTLKRAPQRFTALAIGGYAIWTEEESKAFSESYLPPFRPSGYGEHLTWLWNRILEQTWFFPWFDTRKEARIGVAHADPVRVDAVIREMLDSGDAYRVGYGAVLRAPREVPGPSDETRPVLILAYAADVLYEHIDRLPALPAQWEARKVATPAEQQDQHIAHLGAHACPPPAQLGECADEGFLTLTCEGFSGRLHWRGPRDTGQPLAIHAPGSSLELLDTTSACAIDLPGHGLSDDWSGPAPTDLASWMAVIEAAQQALGCSEIVLPPAPLGDPETLFPDLTPDRFGAYLTRAWSIVRAGKMFAPWYEASAANAIDFAPEALDPQTLRIEHRALLRSRAAKAWASACQNV